MHISYMKMYAITTFLFIFFADFTLNSDAVVQNFYWRDYIPGDIPCDAIKGAPGKYIGQINHKGHVLTATIFPYDHKAISNYGDKLIFKDDVKILCSTESKRIYWADVDFEKLGDWQMEGAMKGGYDSYILYIGRIYHNEVWKIGKVYAVDDPQKGLYVWNDSGWEFKFMQFQILKYNSTIVAVDGSLICENQA